jgi:hypothetical protein
MFLTRDYAKQESLALIDMKIVIIIKKIII